MIDFRYHLISIIAVILALGLGILMGSTVLDDRFVRGLQKQVASFDERNDRLQEQIDSLEDRADASRVFAQQSAPWLLRDRLEGRVVVLVELEGVDGGLVSDVRDAIEDAGAVVPTTITVTEKVSLSGQPEMDQLALAVGSLSESPQELRREAASVVGERLAAAAREAETVDGPPAVGHQRANSLLRELQDTEFIAVDGPEEGSSIPATAMFLVLGGSEEGDAAAMREFAVPLAGSLGTRGAVAMLAEPLASSWGLVQAVREDAETSSRVSTVDQADTIEGRIAIVLGLDRHFEGRTDHYGVTEGASEVIPEPADGS